MNQAYNNEKENAGIKDRLLHERPRSSRSLGAPCRTPVFAGMRRGPRGGGAQRSAESVAGSAAAAAGYS